MVFGRESFCAVRFHEGDLGFDVAGIVDAIATPLAQASIPVLYVSSFSTDIFLVEENRLEDARVALERSIFEFVDTATLRKVRRLREFVFERALTLSRVKRSRSARRRRSLPQ